MSSLKAFDAVAWMRKRREEIESEDAGLTWEERDRRTRELLHGDLLWERVKHRVVPASTPARAAMAIDKS